jgi:surface antigen/cell division septation protein DedD
MRTQTSWKVIRRRRLCVSLVLGIGALVAVGSIAPSAFAAWKPPVWLKYTPTLRAGTSQTLHFDTNSTLKCSLAISGPKYSTHRWNYQATDQQINLTFSAPKTVRAGTWKVWMACERSSGVQVKTPVVVIHVVGPESGTTALVGQHGPYMNVSLSQPIKNIGGGGGAVDPGFPFGQCTYYAWTMRSDIYNVSVAGGAPRGGAIPGDPYGRDWWDAFDWANMASKYGHFSVGTTPEVGSIMVEAPHSGNPYGHVAYVIQVNSATSFVTHEMNTHGDGDLSGIVYTVSRTVLAGMEFIYGGPAGSGPTPPVTTPPVTTPTSTNTYAETTGSVVHTWTDYADAGGTEGSEIASNQTVLITCRVSGWGAPDGNTWWYQIASSPWNNGFYASADAFYNNGETSGSLRGTPFYDPIVPVCGSTTPTPTTPTPTTPTPTTPTPTTPTPTTPTPTTPTPTTPTPTTYPETTGSVAHTWTNYGDAGGTEGPEIASHQTVLITCRVSGWKAPDGNTWWYEIASSPWNNGYFVSADAFYNNGQTSGSLLGTPFYDPSVSVC